MPHIRTISRRPGLAQGQTTAIETIIITLLSVFFQGWDNFAPVIQNLSKFYAKTP